MGRSISKKISRIINKSHHQWFGCILSVCRVPTSRKNLKQAKLFRITKVAYRSIWIYFMGGRNGNINKKIGRTINKCHHQWFGSIQNKVSYQFTGSQQVGKKQAKLFRITFVYRSIWNIFYGWEKRGHKQKIGRTIDRCHHQWFGCNQNKVSYLFAGSQQVGKKQAKLFRITFVYHSFWNIFYGWEKREHKQKNR